MRTVVLQAQSRGESGKGPNRRLRAGAAADPKTRGEHFEQLRKNYPIRREFRFTRVVLPQGHPRLEAKIRNLGFMLVKRSEPKHVALR